MSSWSLVLADSSADLGLCLLRRLQSSFPCRSDTHHSPSAGNLESSLFAWCVWVLQTNHLWSFHSGVPHLHAGEDNQRNSWGWRYIFPLKQNLRNVFLCLFSQPLRAVLQPTSTTDKLSNVNKPQKDEITQRADQKCWHDKCYVWPGFIPVVYMQF